MEALLTQLGIEAREGRHIFEYEAVQLDWWEKEYPVNYEIELIFGDDADIFLFYFVPDTEGVVERSLILVAETAKDSEALINGLLAEEAKTAMVPNDTLTFDEEQGGYLIENLTIVQQVMKAFMALLSNTAAVAHSPLPNADEVEKTEAGSFSDYEVGAIFSHFVSMYFMNTKELDQEVIHNYLQFAQEMEGLGYIEAIQQDAQVVLAEESAPLQQTLLEEHEELQNQKAQLDAFAQYIIDFQPTSKAS